MAREIAGNQPAQHDFLWDLAPGESLFQAGLGSGKTWAGSRKLLMLHAINKCKGLAVAPTYGDLQRFVVPALIEALEDWKWPYKDRTSAEVPAIIVGDHPIFILSAEDPARFAGFEVGHLWGDEPARYKVNKNNPLKDAPSQIRTRLRDKNAKVLHACWTGTPEGIDTWIQRDFVANPISERRIYIGKTRGNALLPLGYVKSLLASLPAEVADQYLNGIACSLAANRAHPGFTEAGNVAEFVLDERLPVHLGSDYNVDPMAWCLMQVHGDKLMVWDELFITGGTNVENAMAEAHAKGWGKYVVHLHPDKSAKARSTVGDPEFRVMQQSASGYGWRYRGTAGGANPPVASRIANLSRLCLNASGARNLIVHPRCKRIIDELMRTARLDSGQYDPGVNGDRGHLLDALGYPAYELFGPKPKSGAVSMSVMV